MTARLQEHFKFGDADEELRKAWNGAKIRYQLAFNTADVAPHVAELLAVLRQTADQMPFCKAMSMDAAERELDKLMRSKYVEDLATEIDRIDTEASKTNLFPILKPLEVNGETVKVEAPKIMNPGDIVRGIVPAMTNGSLPDTNPISPEDVVLRHRPQMVSLLQRDKNEALKQLRTIVSIHTNPTPTSPDFDYELAHKLSLFFANWHGLPSLKELEKVAVDKKATTIRADVVPVDGLLEKLQTGGVIPRMPRREIVEMWDFDDAIKYGTIGKHIIPKLRESWLAVAMKNNAALMPWVKYYVAFHIFALKRYSIKTLLSEITRATTAAIDPHYKTKVGAQPGWFLRAWFAPFAANEEPWYKFARKDGTGWDTVFGNELFWRKVCGTLAGFGWIVSLEEQLVALRAASDSAFFDEALKGLEWRKVHQVAQYLRGRAALPPEWKMWLNANGGVLWYKFAKDFDDARILATPNLHEDFDKDEMLTIVNATHIPEYWRDASQPEVNVAVDIYGIERFIRKDPYEGYAKDVNMGVFWGGETTPTFAPNREWGIVVGRVADPRKPEDVFWEGVLKAAKGRTLTHGIDTRRRYITTKTRFDAMNNGVASAFRILEAFVNDVMYRYAAFGSASLTAKITQLGVAGISSLENVGTDDEASCSTFDQNCTVSYWYLLLRKLYIAYFQNQAWLYNYPYPLTFGELVRCAALDNSDCVKMDLKPIQSLDELDKVVVVMSERHQTEIGDLKASFEEGHHSFSQEAHLSFFKPEMVQATGRCRFDVPSFYKNYPVAILNGLHASTVITEINVCDASTVAPTPSSSTIAVTTTATNPRVITIQENEWCQLFGIDACPSLDETVKERLDRKVSLMLQQGVVYNVADDDDKLLRGIILTLQNLVKSVNPGQKLTAAENSELLDLLDKENYQHLHSVLSNLRVTWLAPAVLDNVRLNSDLLPTNVGYTQISKILTTLLSLAETPWVVMAHFALVITLLRDIHDRNRSIEQSLFTRADGMLQKYPSEFVTVCTVLGVQPHTIVDMWTQVGTTLKFDQQRMAANVNAKTKVQPATNVTFTAPQPPTVQPVQPPPPAAAVTVPVATAPPPQPAAPPQPLPPQPPQPPKPTVETLWGEYEQTGGRPVHDPANDTIYQAWTKQLYEKVARAIRNNPLAIYGNSVYQEVLTQDFAGKPIQKPFNDAVYKKLAEDATAVEGLKLPLSDADITKIVVDCDDAVKKLKASRGIVDPVKEVIKVVTKEVAKEVVKEKPVFLSGNIVYTEAGNGEDDNEDASYRRTRKRGPARGRLGSFF